MRVNVSSQSFVGLHPGGTSEMRNFYRIKHRALVQINEMSSAAMQSRDEGNIVAILEDIAPLPLQLPIAVVDENENARAS